MVLFFLFLSTSILITIPTFQILRRSFFLPSLSLENPYKFHSVRNYIYLLLSSFLPSYLFPSFSSTIYYFSSYPLASRLVSFLSPSLCIHFDHHLPLQNLSRLLSCLSLSLENPQIFHFVAKHIYLFRFSISIL